MQVRDRETVALSRRFGVAEEDLAQGRLFDLSLTMTPKTPGEEDPGPRIQLFPAMGAIKLRSPDMS